MKLDRLILVNWGALRSGEYPMGNMTLLTGPSGAGKSTILDALQTVMTAVYTNIFSYNPSQGETTQTRRDGKTKRTLWSYIVGAEDNLFARPDGAHGYIAAVFKPSEGEQGKEFTALVAASARVDGSGGQRTAVEEKLNLLIIDDAGYSNRAQAAASRPGPRSAASGTRQSVAGYRVSSGIHQSLGSCPASGQCFPGGTGLPPGPVGAAGRTPGRTR